MRNKIEIKTTFSEEVEGTYVVDVEFNGLNYEVNCQSGVDHNYKPTWSLDCVNESGGDIFDSGLLDAISEYLGVSVDDFQAGDDYNKITDQIEKCAESHKTENSFDAVLLDEYDIEAKEIYSIIANFSPETSLYITEHEDGKVTVFCYDYMLPKDTLKVLASFDSIKDWKEYDDDTWFNDWNADGFREGNISYAHFLAKKLGAFDNE